MAPRDERGRFLRWALPRLQLRWEGYRRVRGQVGRRLQRRLRALGLADLAEYRARLEADPEEWVALDAMLHITVSRFRRDRRVWEALELYILPALYERARRRGRHDLRVWCSGCGAGEESYTLALVHELILSREFPRVRLDLLATDADAGQLARARAARYPPGALRDLPPDWVELAFLERGGRLELRPEYRRRVTLRRQDIRKAAPRGPIGLVLCRNVVFTYFDLALQRAILQRLRERMRPQAFLVIGAREKLPAGDLGFTLWRQGTGIWVRDP